MYREVIVSICKLAAQVNLSAVNCLVFSTTGNYLASGHDDGSIHIWDPLEGLYLHHIELGKPVLCLMWDPTHPPHIFCGCQDGMVAYFDKFGTVGLFQWQQLRHHLVSF
jgi:WD40 repeat protein